MIRRNWMLALLVLPALSMAQVLPEPRIAVPVFRADTIRITDFGAKNDLGTINTRAIQSAIDACSRQGGGVVSIPAGVWTTGPLDLKSQVNLHLEANALLQFTNDFSQYPLVKTVWEGNPQMRRHSPIRAEGQRNIAITGKGVIDGNGDAWRPVKKSKLTDAQWKRLVASGGVLTPDGKEWYPTAGALKATDYKEAGTLSPEKGPAFFEQVKDFLRPNLIVLERCDGVLLEGATFQNSGAWNTHLLMSRNVTVRHVTIRNPWYSQNGDGLDIESCQNVLVTHTSFDVGDDAICIKSGKNEYGRKLGMPTENLWVRNCTVYHAHGGFVIGSEMSGGARNLYVSDCTFIGTDIGLRFKTQRGRGGIVENVFINNIYMKDIPGEAILFDMYYEAVDPVAAPNEMRQPPKVEVLAVTEGTPQFRHFRIRNVYCDGAAKALFVRGLPEMHISDIQVDHLLARSDQGIDIQEASDVLLNDMQIRLNSQQSLAYILNSDGITLRNISYPAGIQSLLHVQGERSKKIRLTDTDLSGIKNPVLTDFGANEKEISIR